MGNNAINNGEKVILVRQDKIVLIDRIDALESRNAFQDDVIEQLNREITIHQEQIAELKSQLMLLAGRIRDMKPSNMADLEDETPPPHY